MNRPSPEEIRAAASRATEPLAGWLLAEADRVEASQLRWELLAAIPPSKGTATFEYILDTIDRTETR